MKRTCQDFEKYGHIVALLPEYVDGAGECVVVLYDDGRREVQPRAMRSTLERCARVFAHSVPLVRDCERLLFGRSREGLPLTVRLPRPPHRRLLRLRPPGHRVKA